MERGRLWVGMTGVEWGRLEPAVVSSMQHCCRGRLSYKSDGRSISFLKSSEALHDLLDPTTRTTRADSLQRHRHMVSQTGRHT